MEIKEIIKLAAEGIPTGHLKGLVGKTQRPEWHPEGDAWNHSSDALQYAMSQTDDEKLLCAVLFHDIGKILTPDEELPRHFYHDDRGFKLVSSGQISEIPEEDRDFVAYGCKIHMKKEIENVKTIKKTIRELKEHGWDKEQFSILERADGGIYTRKLPEWINKVDWDEVEI